MNRKREPYPLSTLCGLKNNIDTRPDYQRPAVWKLSNKQLLVDTILRGYDIPKFYWKENNKDNYEVIDGQQRIRTIWDFHENKFKLAKDIDQIDDEDISNKHYKELSINMRKKFDMYLIDIVIVYDVEKDDETREMFLRLQNGMPLRAQNKRHAMVGNMRDFVIKISKLPFFTEKVAYKDNNLAHESTAAQLILLEINGEPTDVRNSNLNNMYKKEKGFDENSTIAKKIKKTISYLDSVFENKTPELQPYYVQTMYMMISKLLENHVIDNLEKDIFNFFLKFDKFRNSEKEKKEKDPDITEFQDKVTHSGDSKASLKWRLNHFLTRFGIEFPNIPLKDKNRNFSYSQRLAIWRRDKQICQIASRCHGKKLTFDEMDADHIKPYVQGGETIVSNGRTSCVECNRSRSIQ